MVASIATTAKRALIAFGLIFVSATLAAPPARAGDPKADETRALELFERGKAEYRQGHFAESVALLQEAYELIREPVLLYNLGRAYEGLGEFGKAIDAFERYLATEKDIPDRGAIEQKVASLKRTLAEQQRLAAERDEALRKKAAQPPPPPRDEPPPEPASPSPWPWVIAGLGAGALVSGGVVGGLAMARNDEAEDAGSQQATIDLRDQAETLATASTALFIAGGVVLAAGATWGIVDVATLPSSTPGPPVARLRLGLGSFLVEGRY